MAQVVRIDDRAVLEAFLRRNTVRHLFEIGDLDDRYWPDTAWYGWVRDGRLGQVAVLYTRPETPVLLLYGDPPHDEARAFAEALSPRLPGRLYAHLGGDLVEVMARRFPVLDHGAHLKMRLNELVTSPGSSPVVAELSTTDADALARFYAEAYPETQVSLDMLSTGRWRGIREGADLVGVAGLHVYSKTYAVAALGGVATHPSARRRGLGTHVSYALCRALIEDGIEEIGLVVGADNAPAIKMYERLGFVVADEFLACTLAAR